MYSGTTFRTKSGRLMGVHQRIDRVARRHIELFLPSYINFPNIKQILHFEGLNGPDGVKRKSPAQDEPWHFIDPTNPNDTALLDMIDEHIANLAKALKNSNIERASFEAAWLAHAIVDGLTPAHHYPLENKIEELRDGQGITTRTSTKEKILLPGKNAREKIKNNWEFWGAKGVMTTHFNFELGVATTISAAKLGNKYRFSQSDIERLNKLGYRKYFLETLASVHGMKMYDEFQRKGWTRQLARETKNELIPMIIHAVCAGWFSAVKRAGENNAD